MRLIELAGRRAARAPLLDELSGLIELDDPRARAGGAAVPLANENVAGRVRDDVVRLIERRRIDGLAGLIAARLPEREQELAGRAELVNLMADDLCRRSRQRRVGRRAAR